MSKQEHTPLSASRIKVAQGCSWLYWTKYKLKLPELGNDGARRGTICHLILEVLGPKKRRDYLKKIKKTQNIFCIPSIERLVMIYARRLGVTDDENIQLIKDMTFNGLSYDFLGHLTGRPTEAFDEQAFDITVDDGTHKFRVRGFIDKLFLYKGKKFALIRDFKTSKAVFAPKEVSDNLQDLMYSFAVSYLFPEYEYTQSEFLFLKFDLDTDKTNTFIQEELFDGNELVATFDKSHVESGVVRMAPLSKEELEGFKHELTSIQKFIDGFSEKTAKSNFAARQDFPKDGTFSGRLLCGFAKKKGELKLDGNPKWHCPMRFEFWYVHVLDKNGNFVSSCFEDTFKESMVPKGGSHELKYYEGCPAHQYSR
jgi:hypothetical protein